MAFEVTLYEFINQFKLERFYDQTRSIEENVFGR